MTEIIETFLYKLRFVGTGLLMLISLILLIYLLSAGSTIFADSSLQPQKPHSYASNGSFLDDSNIVTDSIAAMASDFGYVASTIANAANSSMSSVASVAAEGGKVIGTGISTAAETVYTGAAFVTQKTASGIGFAAQKTGSGIVMILRAPVNAMHYVVDSPAVSTVIRPDADPEVPVIDSQLSFLYPENTQTVTEEVRSDSDHALPPHTEAAWPIHGRVTTLFGVPHRPYQAVHTGIDISSGLGSGKTVIKPFRAGKVVNVVHSKTGLGNHVVVDHGEGLTSLYAHLYSISVKAGQLVDANTVLGYEGSTGMSTGPHLHFEIRVNGQPMNPKNYIKNNP